MKLAICALALSALASPVARAADRDALCNTLRTFEAKSLAKSQSRWVEFHWGYAKMSIWSWGCRHSDDDLAKATCVWLMHHTNQEFSMELPHRIMACHGYRFPKFAFYDWHKMVGSIELRGPKNYSTVMDLAFASLPAGEQAVRVWTSGSKSDVDARPAIEPMQGDAAR